MPRFIPEALAPYAERMCELPFVQAAQTVDVPDDLAREAAGALELELADGSRTTLLIAHQASHLSLGTAQHLRAKLGALSPPRSARHWIVFAPHVGAPLGDAFEASGLDFIDRQGNCHVRVDLRYLARVQGRAAPKPPPRQKELRAPGYQVMFALLADPELLGAVQREIATAAGTSRQPVADLLARFVAEGLVERARGRHAWLRAPDADLLDRFVAGYRATLRPRLVVGRYRLPVAAPEDVEDWVEEQLGIVRYGGTAAAHRLAGEYRGPLTVAHLGPPIQATRDYLAAVPDPDGELVWMRDIGEASARGVTTDTVHPVLVYAELMSDPDPRACDAARDLRERWLPWAG